MLGERRIELGEPVRGVRARRRRHADRERGAGSRVPSLATPGVLSVDVVRSGLRGGRGGVMDRREFSAGRDARGSPPPPAPGPRRGRGDARDRCAGHDRRRADDGIPLGQGAMQILRHGVSRPGRHARGVRSSRFQGDQKAEVNKGLLCVKATTWVSPSRRGPTAPTAPAQEREARTDLVGAGDRRHPPDERWRTLRASRSTGSGQWTIPEGLRGGAEVGKGGAPERTRSRATLDSCRRRSPGFRLATYRVGRARQLLRRPRRMQRAHHVGNNPAEMHPVLFSHVIDRRDARRQDHDHRSEHEAHANEPVRGSVDSLQASHRPRDRRGHRERLSPPARSDKTCRQALPLRAGRKKTLQGRP